MDLSAVQPLLRAVNQARQGPVTYIFLAIYLTKEQFHLRSTLEVDGIIPDMPPSSALHYIYAPRPPRHTPAIGSDILMHRFTNVGQCSADDFCLLGIPKRLNGPPRVGSAIDQNTAWGLHLEEGLDGERLLLWVVLGALASLIFAVPWAIVKGSIQDAFSVAGYVVTAEALAMATMQVALTQRLL